MATTFTWIPLGSSKTEIDSVEGNTTAENASSLVGQTFGSAGTPLYANITTVTTVDNGGTAGALDMDNTVSNDQFITKTATGSTTSTFDGTAIYNATITYADGSTAKVTAVVVQDTAGNLYLAPDPAAGMDEAAYSAEPIASLTLNSVAGNVYTGMGSDRLATGFDDGYVDGTASGDLIDGNYVEAIAGGSDKVDNADAGLAGASGHDDNIRAGAGNDSIHSNQGNDSVSAGDGNDQAYGGDGNDTILGEAGDDSLFGGAGNDALSGGSGNDTLAGGSGADAVDGGAGTDTADYSASGAGVNVTVNGGANSGGDAQGDVLSNIENLTGSGFADTLSGDANTNVLSGGAGSDQMFGGGGNDVFYGGADGDGLFGGANEDLIFGDGGNDTIQFGSGNDTVYGGDGNDVIDDVNGKSEVGSNLIDAGAGNDTVWAGDSADTVQGGTGDDSLLGESGNDQVFGGAGNDSAFGGEGSDVLSGSDGNDRLDGDGGNDSLSGDAGNDVVSGGAGSDLSYGGEGNDQVGGGEGDDRSFGDAGNDTMSGDGGSDQLYGGEGQDVLAGGAGNDTLDGGAGSDRFNVGSGEGSDGIVGGEDKGGGDGDHLAMESAKGGVQLTFSGSESGSYEFEAGGAGNFTQIESVSTGSGDDTITAEGADGGVNVDAGAGQDSLTGGKFDDTMGGGKGDDTIGGGHGNDLITTGEGSDVVEFGSGSGHDTITDFDFGDPEKTGVTNDQFDVSDLDDGKGNPVKVSDIAIKDDGNGNAVLHFPGGESVTIIGLSPDAASASGMLHSMGIPCFASGSMILTPNGECRVEHIAPGDLVLTPDGRAVPVLWHGVTDLCARDLETRPDLRPIRVRMGARGGTQDLIVSPQHCLVIVGPQGPALIRARHLAEFGLGARRAKGMRRVTYHHLLTPRHEIVLANGLLSESFYPGSAIARSMRPADRLNLARAVLGAGPALPGRPTLEQIYGPRCLPVLTRSDARAWAHRQGRLDDVQPALS